LKSRPLHHGARLRPWSGLSAAMSRFGGRGIQRGERELGRHG
jgi:hypothetical protein